MDLIPYNAAQDVVRHHAFIWSDDEDDVLDAEDMRLARTQVITCGGGAEFGVQMRGLDASVHPHSVPKFDRRTIVDIATSAFSAAVVTDTGELYVTGLNDEGQLVPEDKEQQIIATPVLAENLATQKVVSVSCGDHHTAVVNSGAVALSFGSDEFGALGHDSDAANAHPYRIPPRVVRGIGTAKVMQVACGATHSLFLTRDGAVYSCGSGVRGALGLGHREDRKTATHITALTGIPIMQIAAGDNYSCAVSATGLAYSWGMNKSGQCGLPVSAHPHAAYTPLRLDTLPELITLVACGEAHTMWLSHSGRAYAAGKNSHGQLGLGLDRKEPFQDVPTLVSSLQTKRIREIACGARHSIILLADGSVYGTGDCSEGQTGIVLPLQEPPTSDAIVPVDCSSGRPLQSSFCSQIADIDTTFANGTCLWGPTRIPGLSGVGVFRVAAAGDHSLFVRVTRGSVLSTAPGCLSRAFMVAVDAKALAKIGQLSTETQNFAPLRAVLRDVLSHVSNTNASFLLHPEPMLFQTFAPPCEKAPLSSVDLPSHSPTADDRTTASLAAGTPSDEAASADEDSPSAKRFAVEAAGEGSIIARASIPVSPSPSAPLPIIPTSVGPLVPSSLFIESSGIDFGNLEAAYTAVLGSYNPDIVGDLARSMLAILDEMEPSAPLLTEPDALRAILTMFFSPLNSRPAISAPQIARLCLLVLSLPQQSRDMLIKWIGRDAPPLLIGSRLIRPLQAHISFHLKTFMAGRADALLTTCKIPSPGRTSAGDGSRAARELSISHLQAMEYIVRVLRLLYNLNEKLAQDAQSRLAAKPAEATAPEPLWFTSSIPLSSPLLQSQTSSSMSNAAYGALVSHEEFYNQDINNLTDDILRIDYQRWARAGFQRVVNPAVPLILCAYPFIMDAAAKRRILEFEALVQMQTEANNAIARSFFMESPFLDIHVRRSHMLQDTLNQLLSQPPNALKKQLRVFFTGEEGIDAGGPRRELFQLLMRDVLDPRSGYGLFIENEATRETWFSPAALPGMDREYHLIGLLLGLAIYNSVTLDVRFPMLIYKKLLGMQPNFYDFKQANPALADGFEKLLAYTDGDEEDVFCLTWEATYDCFGTKQTVELVPGGKDKPVTRDNKYDYVEAYVDWYVNKSIAASFKEFLRGFVSVMSGPALTLFRPDELEEAVAGTPHLDFKELEKVTKYDGGYTASHATVKMFWNVVQSLSSEQQKKLLLFVTGCPKAPLGGLGKLPFMIQRAGPDTDNLPTASVCFHVLLLPEYASEEKMRDRLTTAIEECAGFGLK